MLQVFHRGFNTLWWLSITVVLLSLVRAWWVLYLFGWSPYVTRAYFACVQPVLFSHKHHVGNLGIN